jgi:hypothetical protein
MLLRPPGTNGAAEKANRSARWKPGVQAAKAAGGHDLRTAEPGRAGALSGAPNCKPLKGRGLASKPAAAGDFANRSLAPIWGTPNGIGKASGRPVPESVESGVSALLKGAFETGRDRKLASEPEPPRQALRVRPRCAGSRAKGGLPPDVRESPCRPASAGRCGSSKGAAGLPAAPEEEALKGARSASAARAPDGSGMEAKLRLAGSRSGGTKAAASASVGDPAEPFGLRPERNLRRDWMAPRRPPRPENRQLAGPRARPQATRPAGRRAGRRAMELGQWGPVATPAPIMVSAPSGTWSRLATVCTCSCPCSAPRQLILRSR